LEGTKSVESSQGRSGAAEQVEHVLPPSTLLDGEAGFVAVEHPRVSIVIPVHDRLDQTLGCLDSLLTYAHTTPFEVLEVDDCSTDATPDALARIRGIRVLTHHVNRGYVAACNKGIAAARGEYVVLLNNDTVVGPGCIDALVATADADPTVGLVGARLIYPDGRLQEAGGIIWSDAHGWNYGKGDNPHASPYCHLRDVDYCSAACLLVRRDLLTKLGGLDLRFSPAYYEDADLAFAARALGYRVVYQPNAAVVHVEGASHGTDPTVGVKRHQVRNRITFQAKWRRELRAQQPDDPSLVMRARDTRPGPRALIADHTVPTHDLDAGSMRMMGIVSLLVDLGFVVTFLPGNMHPQQPYTSELQQMGVEVMYAPVDLASHLAALGPHLRLCVLSRPHVALPFIGLVRKHAPTAVIVYDTVDLHFLRELRQADLENDDALRGVSRVTRELELALVRASDATFTVTTTEQEMIRGLVPDSRVFVVPTIHPGGGDGRPLAARRDLLFVGNFMHPPNIDAAYLLVNEIMPRLRTRLPGARLILAGSHASPEILGLAGDDVEVLGWVPDLGPLYDRVRVFVAPLRFGAGMRGKLCESMSHGLPVVTSTIGGEGIGLVPGRHALVGDTPDRFASEVVRLYGDAALWSTLAVEGRALVADRYSPAAVKAGLRLALDELGVLGPVVPAAGARAG
jgi:GT2 family glycosyltransferase/glycosyltransferase involved in cell wall biosynthesis